MKKNIVGVGIVALATILVILVFVRKNKDEDKSLDLPEIVCWGDSLTVGVGSTGTNYPQNLYERITQQLEAYVNEAEIAESDKERLIAEIKTLQVVNEGWSGESSLAVAARAAGVELQTINDMNFNSMEVEKELYFCTTDQRVVEPWHGEDVIPVMIDGVKGILRYEDNGTQYYFMREDKNGKVFIPAGAKIYPLGLEEYEDDITLVFIGQNGGYLDTEDLISQQKSIIPEAIYAEGRYLILGITSGTQEERQELEAAMEAEYGDNYVNLREFLSGDSVEDFVTELSETDKEAMKVGKVPPCLLAPGDAVHLNEHGYEMIGYAVFTRMMELGFFEETQAKIDTFGQ